MSTSSAGVAGRSTIVYRPSISFLSPLILSLLFLLILFTSSAHAVTYVSGTISQNTTWSASGSPYVVQGSGVTVASGVTLSVEVGCCG